MTTHYTPQQTKEQYEKLPDALKEAMFSADIAEKMFALGKKHGLTIEKTGFMAEEAGLVILGLLPPREFADSLAERLNVSKDDAQTIASEVSHQIFFPLREALKQTHQIEVGEGAILKEDIISRPSAVPPAPTPTLPSVSVPVPPPQTKTVPALLVPTAPPPMRVPLQASPLMPKKSEPIKLEPLTGIGNQKSGVKEMSTMESPKQPQTTSAQVEQKKSAPIVLRPIAHNPEKEISPLVEGMTRPSPPDFLTQEEIRKVAAKYQSADVNIKEQESRADAHESVPQKTEPAKPEPIKLEPLTTAAPQMPPMNPPLGTAKVPPIDLRASPKPAGENKSAPYQGFDPYREPIE